VDGHYAALMAEVTVRDARPDDAPAIAEVWAAAGPLLVRSAARAPADLRSDQVVGRRRWVSELDGRVVGTSSARRQGDGTVSVSVEVHPDSGSRRVGTALLAAALAAFPDAADFSGVSNDDPIALAFAVRNNFVPTGEHRIAGVDPRTVPPAGPAPAGLRGVRLDEVDPELVRVAHNASAADDPSGLSRAYDPAGFRSDWWDSPDNAPELGCGLLDESAGAPVLAAFTAVQVDRARGRSWSSMTATLPAYRGRGLARWVKQTMLNVVAAAGVTSATTANDATNGPMIAVNDALGYAPVGRWIRVQRRILR
jgi:GNAT superfamily N-acetyltransferase